ncbi:MAG: hypothetical protein HYT11_00795, partial [Candidatus Levybacteria bacterium]|nr:hypothetical protein [Candidatus Levybacteria bacterium]
FLGIVIFLLTYFLLLRNRMVLKASGMIIGLTIIINLYWILPNAYFAITKGEEVSLSKIHSLFTEEAFAQSASFGTLKDMALLKNFLFNWGEYIGNDRFGPLLDEWTTHLDRPLVTPIGYFLFILVIVGIFASFRRRDKTSLAFLGVLMLCVFFWLNINPPFGAFFSFLRESLPIFREAFRFPFTKFSILLMSLFSMYFAWTIYLVLTLFEERKKKRSQILIFFVLLASLAYYMLPAFTGNMISRSMKVSMPKAYFSMFDWFNRQEDGRVATLPIHSFWGWTYHSWGYQGAGFLWFGIKQPLLDREFDRWSEYNEQYYREMSQAVYTKDLQAFKNALTKYDISYLIFDKSIIAPGTGSEPKMLFYKEAESLILQSGMFIDPIRFSEYLSVYTLRSKPAPIHVAESPASISQTKHAFLKDTQYESSGAYISSPSDKENTYVFSDLVDNQNRISLSRVTLTQSGLQLMVPAKPVKTALYSDKESFIVADLRVVKTGNTLQILLYPLLPDRKQQVSPIVTYLPLSSGELILSINGNDQFALPPLPNGIPFSLGTVSLMTKNANTFSLYAKKPDKIIIPDFRTQGSYELIACGQSFDQPVYGIDLQTHPNSFSLFGKAAPLCLFVPIEKLLSGSTPNTSLLSVRYLFTGDNPSLCLLEKKTAVCTQPRLKNFVSAPDAQALSYFPLRKDISDLSLQFFLDTTYEKSLKRASYENVSIGIHAPKAQISIKPLFITQALGQTANVLKPNTSLLIPFSGEKQLSDDLMLLPKTGSSCTQGVSVPRIQEHVSKEFVKKISQQYIRYYSQSGSFCDHFSYSTLAHTRAYVIIITSRNLKGLPLRMCITNLETKRCDVYTHLASSSQFTSEMFFLPKSSLDSGEETYGYDINLNNYAISRAESINDVASVQILPFPEAWLQSITLSSLSSEKNASKDVFVLSESYEQGFRAYIVKKSKFGAFNYIKTALPFIFGEKLNGHVVVSGWANGWVLPSDQSQMNNDQIVTIFLPQVLEYIGFLLLLLLPVFFRFYSSQFTSISPSQVSVPE